MPTPVPLPRFADDTERLQVDAFVGEVINNFAASARQTYVAPDATSEDTTIQRLAGIQFEYRLAGRPNAGGLRFTGLVAHGARTVEVSCGGSPCPTASPTPTATPAGSDLYAIIRDSSTLEWQGALRWVVPLNRASEDCNNAPLPSPSPSPTPTASPTSAAKPAGTESSEGCAETWLYPKVQAGFIRAKGATDDVIDNHFIGVGVEHRRGALAYSHVEVGWGRTDFFATKRSRRLKVDALLSYTPGLARSSTQTKEGIAGVFLKGRLDSDLGPGSDDITIFAGLRLDVSRLFLALAQ
jgi:hypothetical protein